MIVQLCFALQIISSMLSTDSSAASFAVPDRALEVRAKALVNPASGLANDYLNIFNEIIMLVENFPEMPEFGPDILAWRPASYVEHYRTSNLPGRVAALEAYARIDAALRRAFDGILDEIAELARQAAQNVRHCGQHQIMYEVVAQTCRDIGTAMGECLARATYIVNYGTQAPADDPQARADRLMERRASRGRRSDDARFCR